MMFYTGISGRDEGHTECMKVVSSRNEEGEEVCMSSLFVVGALEIVMYVGDSMAPLRPYRDRVERTC